MSEGKLLRFVIPVHSSNFKDSIVKLGELFGVEIYKGLNPTTQEGDGYIFMWVNKDSIECCFGTNLYDWFEYNAMIKGMEEAESLVLLYKILR